MTPTRSGSNYSIQSNGSGPRHSSHQSKKQECQPRGEAQIEDARTSTSFQRLASTFDTLIESPEADITSIAVVRPESLPTGNNRDIPVSVENLVYGSKTTQVGTSPKSLERHHELICSSEKFMGPEKAKELLKGWKPMSCKGQVQQINSWLKKQSMLSEDQKRKLAQRRKTAQWKLHKPPQAKTLPQQVPNKPKKTPNTNQKEKQKAKEKEKPKWNKPYPQNYTIPKKEKTVMDNVFNMARTLMEFKKKEEERLNQSFSKK
ncbi:hypothetical protein O181_123185 [Austropuccinia psidii MF-1]|uniref:Uncharacterized protein n=1 Tax=Austropuccinia psidii MF-1 TaxID=1389203 RepID=A0A9Q3KKP7_9BASI|nr:hypothetical protein [Austropuccinia psidii MF-1]